MSGELSRPTHNTTYAPFTPSKSEQRLPPLYYRGCWHRVSRGFLFRYYQLHPVLMGILLFPNDRSLRPEGLHPPRSVASSGLRPLRMILDCSLRRSLGSVSVPVRLTILSDQLPVSLGEPLPHQQADRTRAPPPATGPYGSPSLINPSYDRPSYPVLAHLSAGYPQPEGRLPTRSSPFRHSCIVVLLLQYSRSTCMPNPRCQRSF